MIEMPPPEPPKLEPFKMRALIDHADRIAAFMEAERELVHELGSARSEKYLSGLVEGWRFTGQGVRDRYDGQF